MAESSQRFGLHGRGVEYEIWYLGGGDTGADVRSRFGGKGAGQGLGGWGV